ncbi:hypothetical protein LEMLEM_LOCUS12420, partial [Lemmus lemmus]
WPAWVRPEAGEGCFEVFAALPELFSLPKLQTKNPNYLILLLLSLLWLFFLFVYVCACAQLVQVRRPHLEVH